MTPFNPPQPPTDSASNAVTMPVIGKRETKFRPPRVVLSAVEGWGKTTTAANMKECLLFMSPQEDGYDTLLGAGRVPSVDTVQPESWPELMLILQHLANEESIKYKSIAFDAIGGFGDLCRQHVCDRDYRGEWGKRGFLSFQEGPTVAAREFDLFIAALDRLYSKHGVSVLFCGHVQKVYFSNPEGADYDRYQSNLDKKLWPALSKWVDVIVFADYITVMADESAKITEKSKVLGGGRRVMKTQRTAAYDAKSRYAIPEIIPVPDDPRGAWPTLAAEIAKSIKKKESAK